MNLRTLILMTLLGLTHSLPVLGQINDFFWVGPSTGGKSGEWHEPTNWTPRGTTPNAFDETATIDLAADPYEVRLSRDVLLGGLTLNSGDATLMASGQIDDVGRSIQIAPGGDLNLTRGVLSGDLRFFLDSANVDVGATTTDPTSTTSTIVIRSGISHLADADGRWNVESPRILIEPTGRAGAQLDISRRQAGAFELDPGTEIALVVEAGEIATLRVGRIEGAGFSMDTLENSGTLVAHPDGGSVAFGLELINARGGLVDLGIDAELGPARGSQTFAHTNQGQIHLRGTANLSVPSPHTLTNRAGGVIDGSGNITNGNPLLNSGQITPGLTISGDLVNDATARLPFSLAGTRPGTDFQQLNVLGDVTLGGTLELQLADEFVPAASQEFELLRGGSLSGQFDKVVLPFLRSADALQIATGANTVVARIKEPLDADFASPQPISVFESGSFNVNGGPATDWRVQLHNVAGVPQVISVEENQTVHSIDVAGSSPAETVLLKVESGVYLGMTDVLAVGQDGQVELAGGERLLPRIRASGVQIDGGTVSGYGVIEADVFNRGLLTPGAVSLETTPAVLTIDGDFVQSAEGVLEIDVFNDGNDQLHVTGDLTLAGLVVIDVMGQPLFPGDAILAVASGGHIEFVEEPLCIFLKSSLGCELVPGIGGLDAVGVLSADFDDNGIVDRDDFSVWQMNFGMFDIDDDMQKSSGDADQDGDVDGDDLLVWQLQLGMTQPLMEAVPEPGSLVLLLVCFSLLPIFARQ